MSSQLLGIAAVAFTVLLWGASGVAIKMTSVTGIVTAFYRTWCAIPLLWMTMLSPPLRHGLDREWLRVSCGWSSPKAGRRPMLRKMHRCALSPQPSALRTQDFFRS